MTINDYLSSEDQTLVDIGFTLLNNSDIAHKSALLKSLGFRRRHGTDNWTKYWSFDKWDRSKHFIQTHKTSGTLKPGIYGTD